MISKASLPTRSTGFPSISRSIQFHGCGNSTTRDYSTVEDPLCRLCVTGASPVSQLRDDLFELDANRSWIRFCAVSTCGTRLGSLGFQGCHPARLNRDFLIPFYGKYGQGPHLLLPRPPRAPSPPGPAGPTSPQFTFNEIPYPSVSLGRMRKMFPPLPLFPPSLPLLPFPPFLAPWLHLASRFPPHTRGCTPALSS